MNTPRKPRVALLYPGDRAARLRSDPNESRFATLFEAFAAAGVAAEPAIYHDDFSDEVAAQLRDVDGVLVWSNPVESDRRRDRLDAMLREAGRCGVFVSSHPDVILRLGTKDVLLDVRNLPFGSERRHHASTVFPEIERVKAATTGAQSPRRQRHAGFPARAFLRSHSVDP